MEEPDIRNSVAEVLGIPAEDLTEALELASLPEYDSTARLSLLVCLSDVTGQCLEWNVLPKLKTYGDIVALVTGISANGNRP